MSRRVTVLTGHYGSGKTSVAVGLALALAREGKPVALADMDIVNPYFRAADRRRELTAAGVSLIVSDYAGTNLDTPALPRELYGVITDRSRFAVLDVGGDERGALALGRYADMIKAGGAYEALFVVNFYRPLTASAEDAAEALREIELAGKLPCTGLVNNSNLGPGTEAADVLRTMERMEALSNRVKLPVRFTAAAGQAYAGLCGRLRDLMEIDPLAPI